MNNFQIDRDYDARKWVVTCRNTFSTGFASYEKDCVVLTYPISQEPYGDVKLILQTLASKVSYMDHYVADVADRTLALIPSDKFIPITVLSQSPTKCATVAQMFKKVDNDEFIRSIAVNAAKNVCPKYVRYVEGAFVSTIPTIENIEALRDKMGKTPAALDIDPVLFKAILAYYLHAWDAKNNQMIPSVEPNTPYCLKYNPNAGVGFKHWDIPTAKTKRDFAPFARRALKRIIKQMPDFIGRSEYLIPPMVHVYTAKPEVRPVDGDLGKIRLIGMVGQMHDQITKMVDSPFLVGFRRWSGCMIGSSIWSSLPYLLMYHLHIGEFNKLPESVRLHFKVPEVQEDNWNSYKLWVADISGQDVSFTAAGLFAFLMLRYFWVDVGDEANIGVFNEFSTYETASANAKIVQWFGQMWYIVLGIMTSGYHTTSDMDSVMLVIMVSCAIVEICRKHRMHPKKVLESCKIAVYGDDLVGRMPVEIAALMGEDETGYPVILAAQLQVYGVTLKRGESKFYTAKRSHRNTFFTRIVDDEIVSEGVHMLQRHFVKYDMDMKPLHPDAKNFAYVMPWRKTEAYATRMGTDAQGFKGKEGRADDRDMDPRLGAYVKAFGLLMDAGPNMQAHRLIKHMMRELAEHDRRIPKAAFQVGRGKLEEVFRKLDPYLSEECFAAISKIWKWTDEESYWYVVSHIQVSDYLMNIKNPQFKYLHVADLDNIRGKVRTYVKNGKFIHINVKP